ncbi:MAG: hypothetical protein IJT58_01140 [Synergistaceae bacterium]|nr:hypothetical protein [Synergistaceae bacterium]
MNKKIFTGLLLLLLASTLIMSGGCNSSNNSFSGGNTGNDVNSKLNGAWTANSGTISAHLLAAADKSASTADTGTDIPNDVLEQLKAQSPDLYELYTQAKEVEAAESEGTAINAYITSMIAIFQNSNISEDTGTAKLTSVIIVSSDNAQIPILLNGVTLNTSRGEQNSWIADIADVGSLNILMNSDGTMNFSGSIEYLKYNWTFDSVISKAEHDDSALVTPSELLEGVWKFDKSNTGGYMAVDAGMVSALNPEDVSVAFSTNEQGMTNMASSYYMGLNSAINALDYYDTTGSGSELKDINVKSGTLTYISGNVCKFKAEDSSECLILIESSGNKIFLFSSSTDNTQTYMFLPLTRLNNFDSTLNSLLGKTWTGSTGNGGGYVHISKSPSENPDDVLLYLIMSRMSLFLESCNMSFSDTVINNDNTVKTTFNLVSSFNVTSEYLKELGAGKFDEPITMDFTTKQASLTRIGNILKYHNAEEDGDEDTLYISFMSENKALIVSKSQSQAYEGEMRVVAVLDAN